MQYTIQAVSPETRQYDTKFGPMVSYKVKFAEYGQPVEISRKNTSQAPRQGEVLEGNIEEGQYGPKFKKEYNQGGFTPGFQPQNAGGSTTQGSSASSGRFGNDQFTMYLSYAKDIAVALIGSNDGFNEDEYANLLKEVELGGKTLYEGRPGAEPAIPAANTPQQDVTEIDDSKPIDMTEIDKIFGPPSNPSSPPPF